MSKFSVMMSPCGRGRVVVWSRSMRSRCGRMRHTCACESVVSDLKTQNSNNICSNNFLLVLIGNNLQCVQHSLPIKFSPTMFSKSSNSHFNTERSDKSHIPHDSLSLKLELQTFNPCSYKNLIEQVTSISF